MKIDLQHNQCIVTREPGDPKYYGNREAAGESRLLYAIKNQLNRELGLGLIKKRMWKDGHLVSEMQQYLRNKNGSIAIYNPRWLINGANDEFNAGKVVLAVENLARDGLTSGAGCA